MSAQESHVMMPTNFHHDTPRVHAVWRWISLARKFTLSFHQRL